MIRSPHNIPGVSMPAILLAIGFAAIVASYVVLEVLPVRSAQSAMLKRQEAAENAVRSVLRDPGSAQFSEFKEGRDGSSCGSVNAKNAMGGYVGSRRYIVASAGDVMMDGSADRVSFEIAWSKTCR